MYRGWSSTKSVFLVPIWNPRWHKTIWGNYTNLFFLKTTMIFYIIWFLVISIVSVIDDVQKFMMADTAEVRLGEICVMKFFFWSKQTDLNWIEFTYENTKNFHHWFWTESSVYLCVVIRAIFSPLSDTCSWKPMILR